MKYACTPDGEIINEVDYDGIWEELILNAIGELLDNGEDLSGVRVIDKVIHTIAQSFHTHYSPEYRQSITSFTSIPHLHLVIIDIHII